MSDRYERDTPSGNMPNQFDRMLGEFDGLPNSLKTDERVIRALPHFGIGGSTTYLLSTIRRPDEKDRMQDWIFMQVVRAGEPVIQLVLPPAVTNAIASQRDALTSRSRRSGARRAVETKRERGIPVGNAAALRKANRARKAK